MEAKDPTKSRINRCRHGCYNPHGTPDGTDNDVCSVCSPVPIPHGHRWVYARDDNGAFKEIEDLA